MLNSQPAGGRLVQNVMSSLSPSSQALFSDSHMPQPSPATDQVIATGSTDPIFHSQTQTTPTDTAFGELDEATKLAIFDEILTEVEQGNKKPFLAQAVPQPVVTPEPVEPALEQPVEDQAAVTQASEVDTQQPAGLLEPSTVETAAFEEPQPPITEPAAMDVQDEVETPAAPSVLDQAVPVAVSQPQPQPYGGGRQKELLESSSLAPTASAELPGGVQYVEHEKSPEISPEVESFIEQVEEDNAAEAQAVVIAQDAPQSAPSSTPAPRIVRVLPITKAQEEVGLRKNSSFSIRWLVEFGHKLAKIFVGEVIYRKQEN